MLIPLGILEWMIVPYSAWIWIRMVSLNGMGITDRKFCAQGVGAFGQSMPSSLIIIILPISVLLTSVPATINLWSCILNTVEVPVLSFALVLLAYLFQRRSSPRIQHRRACGRFKNFRISRILRPSLPSLPSYRVWRKIRPIISVPMQVILRVRTGRMPPPVL